MLDLLGGWLLGLLLGVRHAFEPDHLATVSTLVTTERSPGRAALVGAVWGVGHGLTLLGIWAVLALLQAELPPRLVDLFECAASLLLIILGARALYHVRLGERKIALQAPDWSFASRPLGAGALHGAAGSGALIALVMAGLPSPLLRAVYIVLFAVGSMLGMVLLTGLFAWPLSRYQGSRLVARFIPALTGVLAMGVGVRWSYPLLVKLLS